VAAQQPSCADQFMKTCEILEVRNSADESGEVCGHVAMATCADCGSGICAEHPQTCERCGVRFCGGCLSFHLANHGKPVEAERPSSARKSA
jgi:hypothetical protein